MAFDRAGNLWYTDSNSTSVVNIKRDGTVKVFSPPDAAGPPFDIAATSDGSVWYTEQGANELVQISPKGKTRTYRLPNGVSPDGLVADPHDNLWFSARTGYIGKWSRDSGLRLFPVPELVNTSFKGQGKLHESPPLALGERGLIWTAYTRNERLVRISDDGLASAVPEDPGQCALPNPPVVASNDGSVWFYEPSNSPQACAVRLDLGSRYHTFKVRAGTPEAIDRDGNLWSVVFEQDAASKILERISPSGTVSDFTNDVATFEGVFVGWGGDLWAETVDKQGNKVFAQVVPAS